MQGCLTVRPIVILNKTFKTIIFVTVTAYLEWKFCFKSKKSFSRHNSSKSWYTTLFQTEKSGSYQRCLQKSYFSTFWLCAMSDDECHIKLSNSMLLSSSLIICFSFLLPYYGADIYDFRRSSPIPKRTNGWGDLLFWYFIAERRWKDKIYYANWSLFYGLLLYTSTCGIS